VSMAREGGRSRMGKESIRTDQCLGERREGLRWGAEWESEGLSRVAGQVGTLAFDTGILSESSCGQVVGA
jgi:hypothetical protein